MDILQFWFFLINSPIEEHLGYFQILAITNRAAIYIHVHLYFYMNVSVHFSTVDTQEKWSLWMQMWYAGRCECGQSLQVLFRLLQFSH